MDKAGLHYACKLYQFFQEEWSNIQPELREKLVDGYQKCMEKCEAVCIFLTRVD